MSFRKKTLSATSGFVFSALAAIAVSALPSSALATGEKFDSSEIKERIIGKRIYLATPFGGEFPLNYRRNGKVDGNGEALGLGRWVKPEDTGRWWIQSNRLCQQFTTWYDGEAMCFDLIETGRNSLKWIRNNGQTGTARIGSSL